MRKAFAISLLSLQILWAQSPRLTQEPGLANSELDRRFQQQIIDRWALDPGGDERVSARKQADAQIREFYAKAQRFVELWQNFAHDANQRTFNAKLAKQVSKAFHDLEKCDGWPVGRSK